MCLLLETILKDQGLEVITASDGVEAIEKFKNHNVALTILDVKIPKMNGMQVLQQILSINEKAIVIMLTAYATIKTAVEAIKMGAFDYITKPFEVSELERVVQRGINVWQVVSENQRLKQQVKDLTAADYFVGDSAEARLVFEMIEKVAPTDYTVLITGESGTGKSLLAKVIHQRSERRNGPFIGVNCAAIPPTLVESELFGHEKGAFTGAHQRKIGKIERANGGTLFLDEISTLSLTAQATLLQVLQEKQFERVGGTAPVKVDLRVIAATNRDLRQLVAEGLFREDLYYRLNVITIRIPSLRERCEDLVPLAHYLLQKLSPQRSVMLAPETCQLLKQYSWPGNIREMENVLRQALVMVGNQEVILPEHLPAETFTPAYGWKRSSDQLGLKEMLRMVERDIIQQALKENDMDVSKAAVKLKIPLRTLYYRIKKLEIEVN